MATILVMGDETGQAEPVQSTRPSASNRRQGYILAGVLAALVVGGVIFGVWKYNQVDTTRLAAQVRDSMNHELSMDANFAQFDLDVKTVTVIHASGNEYTGIASVTSAGGPEHSVPISVTFDGEKILWKSEPGAFMFAAQQKFQNAG